MVDDLFLFPIVSHICIPPIYSTGTNRKPDPFSRVLLDPQMATFEGSGFLGNLYYGRGFIYPPLAVNYSDHIGPEPQ